MNFKARNLKNIEQSKKIPESSNLQQCCYAAPFFPTAAGRAAPWRGHAAAAGAVVAARMISKIKIFSKIQGLTSTKHKLLRF